MYASTRAHISEVGRNSHLGTKCHHFPSLPQKIDIFFLIAFVHFREVKFNIQIVFMLFLFMSQHEFIPTNTKVSIFVSVLLCPSKILNILCDSTIFSWVHLQQQRTHACRFHRLRMKKQRQCSCLENPRDGGAWCAAVYGVTQSRTRLKWLSSSSSSSFTETQMSSLQCIQGDPS